LIQQIPLLIAPLLATALIAWAAPAAVWTAATATLFDMISFVFYAARADDSDAL
jgi:hypothetical protein